MAFRFHLTLQKLQSCESHFFQHNMIGFCAVYRELFGFLIESVLKIQKLLSEMNRS